MPSVSNAALTIDQVSQLLNCSYWTAYRLVRAGELPAVKVGKVIRITSADLAAYIESHRYQHTVSQIR